MNSTQKEKEKVFLIGVAFSNKDDVDSSLKELERLSETAGLEVVGKTYQYIREITPATLFGSGKVDELKILVKQLNADVLVVDYELTGSQCKNISEILEIKVIDRITLILDIFALRANSNEGKLQVELAQLKYNLPRLSNVVGTSGRFGSGGVGMRGPGETKLETDRRIIKFKINKLEQQIKLLKQQRELNRENRKLSKKFKVVIVGYTNAGKSTFLNTMAKENIYADDKLFATLDTTTRNVWLSPDIQIVLTDTVGFISKLPHSLIDSFASTLEETQYADLILHIIDISNKQYKQQMSVVEKVLSDLMITAPVINVYNKCDNLVVLDNIKPNEVYISAKKKLNIEKLKDMMIEILSKKIK